jgi:hypothetical protein
VAFPRGFPRHCRGIRLGGIQRPGDAAVDFGAAAGALDAGVLPCSGERRMLRIAASIAEGVPVDLREAVTGLDENNAVLAAAAVLRAAGFGDLRVAAGGERR